MDLTEKVREYGRLGLEGAVNTQRAYRADLKDFNGWCETNGQIPFPVSPETIAAYVSHLADACKWATINRRLAAISKLHQLNDVETPTQNRMFRVVMEGIKRTKGNEIGALKGFKSYPQVVLFDRNVKFLTNLMLDFKIKLNMIQQSFFY